MLGTGKGSDNCPRHMKTAKSLLAVASSRGRLPEDSSPNAGSDPHRRRLPRTRAIEEEGQCCPVDLMACRSHGLFSARCDCRYQLHLRSPESTAHDADIDEVLANEQRSTSWWMARMHRYGNTLPPGRSTANTHSTPDLELLCHVKRIS